MDTFLHLFLAALLILLNGFFVAAEFAIIRVRRTRVDELAEEGQASAKAVQRILGRLDMFLSATQLGVTMATLGLSLVGEPVFVRILAPLLRAAGLAGHPHILGTVSLIVGFALITYLEVVFGELLPKWSVIAHTDQAAFAVAYPMSFFVRLFYPLIWFLQRTATFFARLIGVNPATVGAHETAHSEDEITAIVEAAERSGTIGANEAEIVDNVFKFAHTTASQIMVPRVDIVYLSTTWTIGKNVEIAVDNGYTRYPLCEGDRDHIIGMVHIKDLLAIAGDPDADIMSVKREIPVVPENKPIDELLRELQKSHGHQAVVMDEYGGTAGLVTLEDILEELVGEIQDEYDRPAPIEKLADDRFVVASAVPIEEVTEELGITFENDADFETVGGYALHALHLAPRLGAHARLDGFDVSVAEVQGRRIRRLLFVKHPAAA